MDALPRLSGGLVVTLLATAAACSTPPIQRDTPPATRPSSADASASAPAPPSTVGAVPVQDVAPPSTVPRLPGSPPYPSLPPTSDVDRGFRPGEAREMLQTLAEQGGIKLPARYGNHGPCVRRRVGARDGLLCEAGISHSEATGHSVSSMALFTLEGATLREVFSFPTEARALDFIEALYATLRVDYDAEQGQLQLTDGSRPCDRAITSPDESLEYQRVVDRLCNARGLYVLTNGAFVRRTTAPRLRWPGGPRRPSSPPLPGGSR